MLPYKHSVGSSDARVHLKLGGLCLPSTVYFAQFAFNLRLSHSPSSTQSVSDHRIGESSLSPENIDASVVLHSGPCTDISFPLKGSTLPLPLRLLPPLLPLPAPPLVSLTLMRLSSSPSEFLPRPEIISLELTSGSSSWDQVVE